MPSFGDILHTVGTSLYNAVPDNSGIGGMGSMQPQGMQQQPQQQQPTQNDLLAQLLASIGIHPHQGGPNYLGMLGQQRGPGY